MQAVIIGASGGIGAAFVQALAVREGIECVHALSRSGSGPSHEVIKPGQIDLTDESSIAAAAERVKAIGAPDLAIVASGILFDGQILQPEKSFRHQSAQAFERVFAINTFGPALVAKHFLPIMPRRGRAVFAALSARVGSISDNRAGGWHSYRASKAALNMLIRNFAIEQKRRNENFIAVSLHPGTVDTNLSKPFQSNVPDKQLFTPEQSASYLLNVIAGLTPDDSGKAFDWAGKEIPA
ncbi:SDR family NAD(P)-dependent oxidoreductase [Hyphomonas sp. FCG-A18]|uniref:SDR family NAD(P)-dependent oxidoreductase n=1 Tax=Hyphomonas sp. FCG-A18 TaxID=3080019 RepID=UPI002B2D2F95|nr:SDR family NAD(P)-dependent oxidoreductase [Hyphomonas sp. FCG-A18]